MNFQPKSDHDWTIHSINIHGVFFERWCQKTITDTKVWKIKSTNYPVEFPPPNGPWRGRESTLDIRAELRHGHGVITLLIECKKNNPGFVNWVLFAKNPPSSEATCCFDQIENIPATPPGTGWQVETRLISKGFIGPVADEARETRGTYESIQRADKTKTSNAAINEAAHQVALATRAVVIEEAKYSEALRLLSSPPQLPWRKQAFIPMIVTTAHLYTCEFDPLDVDSLTGELPYHKANLKEVPYLIYEYPLPRHLQNEPAHLADTLLKGSIGRFTRMHIFAVHSGKLIEALQEIAALSSSLVE